MRPAGWRRARAPSGASARTDLWTLVAAERGALADDLTDLTPDQWATRSLCPDWTVRDVVAHLTAAASTSPGSFVGQFAKARFDFDT